MDSNLEQDKMVVDLPNATTIYLPYEDEDPKAENLSSKYYLLQSANPNLSDCRPTILRTELDVSFEFCLGFTF